MRIVHLHLRVETELRDVHPLKPVADLFNHLSDLFKDVQVKISIATPLSLLVARPTESDSLLHNVPASIVVLNLVESSRLLLLHRVIRIDLFVLEMRVKLMDPLQEDAKEHNRVGVSIVVVVALEFCQIHLVHKGASVGLKEGPCLLMDASHNNRLLHAFERHAEEEKPCNFEVTRKIHENLAQSSNFASLLCFGLSEDWRHRESTSLLKIFNGVANITVLRRLNCSTENFFWLILIP
jgi:hypothetical protein